MIRRMRVVRAPAVEEWLAAPHNDLRVANVTRARFLRAERVIEQMGTLAGDDSLKKLPGFDSLYETPVGNKRVFSTIEGNMVLMAVVVEKKKKRLTAGQLKPVEAQVKRFAETFSEENRDRSGR
jgi:hypothetical protein